MAEKGDLLARSELFAGLSAEDRERIEALARRREVPRGREVLKKGAAPTEFFAVVEGEARVTAPSPDGRELYLRVLRAGDVFGEIGVFDLAPRTARVTALTDMVLAAFDARDLREHLRKAPAVSLELLSVMARRLRHTTQLLEDNVFLKVEARLAKTLLALLAEGAEDTPEGRRIAEKVSQGALAKMVGTAREGVNRQLGAWERDGVISRRGDHIVVVDAAFLEALAPAGPL